jgi:hypothetical protein
MTKSAIFKAAWSKAKAASKAHGGKSRDYFPASLKAVYDDIAYSKKAAATRNAGIESKVSTVKAICVAIKSHRDADNAIKQLRAIQAGLDIYPVQVKTKERLDIKKQIIISVRDDVLVYLNNRRAVA